MWGYSKNDENGTIIEDGIEHTNMELIFNAKDNGTIKSARWKQDYNPDLCIFLEENNAAIKTTPYRTVLCDFPNSQHRPVLIDTGVYVPGVQSIPKKNKKKRNFKKAKWVTFKQTTEENIQNLLPIIRN